MINLNFIRNVDYVGGTELAKIESILNLSTQNCTRLNDHLRNLSAEVRKSNII